MPHYPFRGQRWNIMWDRSGCQSHGLFFLFPFFELGERRGMHYGSFWQGYLDGIWIYAGGRKCLARGQIKRHAVENSLYKPFGLLTVQPLVSPAFR